MAVELLILGWGAVLAVVHILVAIHLKTRQYGRDWNTGARDGETPPLNAVAARLERARDNYLETFPVAIVALAGTVLADRTGTLTAIGGALWLAMRVVYLPLYWTGVPKVRTLVWLASMVGLALALWPLLIP